jgi:transcriptional regulator GlxA family with amidase domain
MQFSELLSRVMNHEACPILSDLSPIANLVHGKRRQPELTAQCPWSSHGDGGNVLLALAMTPKRIGLIGFDRITALHLAGPADVFAAAVLDDGYGGQIACYEVCIIGLTSSPFRSESGLVFTPEETFQTAPALDTIIIPGGSGLRDPHTATEVSSWILTRVNQTRRIVSVCTGIYGLAPTGLLDGREVTTHWRFARDVARRFPQLRVNHKARLVRDGPFYTSTGLSAGIDLALQIVEEDYGPQVARAAQGELVTHLARRDTDEQSATLREFESRPADRFGDLVAWIIRNLEADLSVEALARRACMCPSHFNRSFKAIFGSSPADFVENLRLNEARRRLSKRSKTLQSVGASVGFKNSGAFRRAFQRRFGVKAGSYLEPFPSAVAGESNEALESVLG